MTPLRIPGLVRTLAEACAAKGGRAYLVGGCVRDHLMHLDVKDWDIEVYRIREEELNALLQRLGRVNLVGRSFGVFKLHRGDLEVDVSIPRRDSKIGPGHRGIQVRGDPSMSVTEATRRRDLTINAMLFDISDGTLLDPWNGRDDLERGLLRAVDPNTFLEDPLRALRAVQFAARLQFAPTPELVELCRRAALSELPAERVQEEWRKLFLRGRRPSIGLQLAREAELTRRLFPEIAHLDASTTDEVLDRLVPRRDLLEPEGRRYALMLAGWLHRTTPEEAEAILDRLWLHKWKGYPLRTRVLESIVHWRAPTPNLSSLRHLSTRAELELTLTLRHGIRVDSGALDALERARRHGFHQDPPPPFLKGRHLKSLGISPGPHMGKLLAEIYTLQLDGTIRSPEEARAEVVRRANPPPS